MNHKPNRFNDILTNIVTGVTITAWGTAVILPFDSYSNLFLCSV